MTQYYVFTDLDTGYVTSCTVEETDKQYIIHPLVAHGGGSVTDYETFTVDKAYKGYEYKLEKVN